MNRVFVGVKRVLDYATRARVAADGLSVDLNNVKMSINPFCEIAVEEAVRLKENKKCNEVIVCTIGPKQASDVLRTALAMGCDEGIHILTEENERIDQDIQPLSVAQTMQHIITQGIDDDMSGVGPMLSTLLNYPQITCAANIDVIQNDNDITCEVERETDTGSEVLTAKTPLLVTADLRLNEPRYPTLPNIMKAKKKKIKTIKLSDILSTKLKENIVGMEAPQQRESGIMVEDVDTLIDKLKNEKKVL